MNSSIARNLEYDFQEVRGHKVYNMHETNIMFAAEVLRNEVKLNPEMERIKVMLETTISNLEDDIRYRMRHLLGLNRLQANTMTLMSEEAKATRGLINTKESYVTFSTIEIFAIV